MLDLSELEGMSDEDIERRARESPEWFEHVMRHMALALDSDQQERQLAYYKPANPMAAPIHNSVAREIAIVGGNRTQPAGAKVLMGRGLVPVEEVVVGDEALGYSSSRRSRISRGKPKKYRRNVVTSTYVSDTPVSVLRLTTKRGYTLDGGEDHGVWACDPSKPGWHGGVEPVRATARMVSLRDLKPGMYVALRYRGAFPRDCRVTADDAYFLGLMSGDGHWASKSARGVMCFTSADEDTVLFDWLEAYLSRQPDIRRSRRHHKAQTNGTTLSWCSIPFKERIESWGVSCKLGPDKAIPECIWLGTKAVVAAFLRGLMDTDGCATTKPSVVFVNNSEALARGVHQLLLRFGIVASRYLVAAAPHRKRPNASWRVEITGSNLGPYRDEIGFLLERKRARLPAVTATPSTKWDRVRSVTEREPAFVHGFNVEPSHCYQGDGFLNRNSSKTDTMLAELVIQMTGHIPLHLLDTYPREKIRAPIRARVVCNSLTDTLEPVIKPKLRWDQWNGVGEPKEGRGHWGWVPRHLLTGGKWESAYSEKYRTLSVSVDNFWHDAQGNRWSTTGTSTCQFLSYDQELTAFAGSSMHFVGHDELPPSDVYRENRMRTLDVKGQIMTAFTPPDEIGAARADVAWFYDEIYEQGLSGPNKHPQIDTFVLFTERNAILSGADIADLASRMTDEQREVRLHGRFLHLSGVIYSLFTQHESWWCFRCVKRILPVSGTCATCNGDEIVTFSHVVEPFTVPQNWPVVFVIDPHPRKKDAMGWFAITPSDDIILIHEMEQDGTAADVAKAVREWEEARRVYPVKRLMDPNIATETNDKLDRGWTMRRAYDQAGLRCDLATDDINSGIQNVNELLRPDPRTRRPRFSAFSHCRQFVYGMTHWAWDEWTRQHDREPKERVRDRHKDFPDLLRYLANDLPSFNGYTRPLRHRPRVVGY